MTYYSQHGEDKVLEALFPGKTDGYFIEVWALDGRRFSNTLTFEERGWTGLLIEPHPAYVPLLRKNRPGATVLPLCASDKNEVVTFYSNARGSLSTMDASLESMFREGYGPWFHGFVPLRIPARRLTTILDFLKAPKEPDILSVDAEGCDHLVLAGLDLKVYRPRVVVVEFITRESRDRSEEIMAAGGYSVAREISNNFVFCREPEDVRTIETADGTCELVHTENTIAGEVKK